jgi:hypothetical protein
MAIDTTPSQVATSALQAIPFGSIIGGPLNACIEAQAQAALTSWKFIDAVGLMTDKKTGEKKTVNVSFQFMQNGRMAQINVPLLTIVPIPYIAIQSVDIAFKANISASSSSTSETSSSSALDAELGAKAKIGYGPFGVSADMKANYSSKKDSKSTQESKYSVEYTMDVAVKAGQDSMPAGLAKVLELLNGAMDVSDPKGTLEVSDTNVKLVEGESAQIIATYKNSEGLFKPEDIKVSGGQKAAIEIDGNNAIITLSSKDDYTITAGTDNNLTVHVE